MPDRTLPENHPGAHIASTSYENRLKLSLDGHLDAAGTASIWESAVTSLRTDNHSSVIIDCARISYMDGAGLALLLKMQEEATRKNATVELRNLSPKQQQLIDMTRDNDQPQQDSVACKRHSFRESVGQMAAEGINQIKELLFFVGESAVVLSAAILHPGKIRWKDVVLSCIHVGVDSLFILTLLGFVMGLIMSFQSAVTLEKFGGQIFIPNMLGLVMFREMGPLVTAILLAARSGSAFAAEIGTMKVNEELDALTTMGLSPMRFLVVPRILSAFLMVPLMTIFFNATSLIGGAVVMLSIGFPLTTFTSRVFSYVGYLDFWGGILKALTFALLVAGIGCLRGIQTKNSASAVGLSTTSAVVSGIILIAFADGMFAIAFYCLGW